MKVNRIRVVDIMIVSSAEKLIALIAHSMHGDQDRLTLIVAVFTCDYYFIFFHYLNVDGKSRPGIGSDPLFILLHVAQSGCPLPTSVGPSLQCGTIWSAC